MAGAPRGASATALGSAPPGDLPAALRLEQPNELLRARLAARRHRARPVDVWERGTWEAKGTELRLSPQSQEHVERMLNTVAKR